MTAKRKTTTTTTTTKIERQRHRDKDTCTHTHTQFMLKKVQQVGVRNQKLPCIAAASISSEPQEPSSTTKSSSQPPADSSGTPLATIFMLPYLILMRETSRAGWDPAPCWPVATFALFNPLLVFNFSNWCFSCYWFSFFYFRILSLCFS